MMVSVVLPSYNEEGAIGKVIEDVKATLDKTTWDYEIIVVNDASTDKTAEIAAEKGVRVINHLENKGSGASRKTGILASCGDYILFLDADNTYPARQIPLLLEHLPQYDQVIGARTSEKGSWKILRTPTKWAIKKLASILAGRKIPDLNSGMRVLKKDVLLKFLPLIPDGFSCVSTMTLAFLVNGFSVKFVPIDYYPRVGKSKFHPVKDTYNYILTVIRMIMYFNPLRIFFPASLTLLVFGVGKSFFNRYFGVGHMQLSDVVIILSALIIMAIGFLADLIAVLLKHTGGWSGKEKSE